MSNPIDGELVDGARRGTAVVTGAGGFIGAHLVAGLTGRGMPVVGVDRCWTGAEADTPAWGVADELASMDLDRVLRNARVVFHLAGRPGVRRSWDSFAGYQQDNILVTQRLLDACVRSGVPRVVLASSSSVYGDAVPMAEDRPPSPMSPYAVTKLAAEHLGQTYAARAAGMVVVAVRYFTVYGPGQRPDMLVARALRSAVTGEVLQVYGDGEDRRDFTYVGDVVAATIRAASADVPGGAYNVGTGTSTSVNDLIASVAEVTGHAPRVRYGAARAGDVPVTRADLTKSARTLGYRPTVPLPRGVAAQAAAPDTVLERAR